jgi:hypothetical protein
MKKIFTLLLLATVAWSAQAQKIIEKSLPFSKGQKVDLNLKFADDIKINYWDKNEVYMKVSVEINSGKLNDALLVEASSQAQTISMKTDFDKELIKKGKREDCPGNNYSHYNDGGNVVCSDINYEVYLPRQAELKVETISGNIDIRDAAGPVYAKTISGFVDMSWPGNKGANVSMKSITGELYSDLDISFTNKKDKPAIVGYKLEGTLNGGGPEVRLESISNNIYLRKKN